MRDNINFNDVEVEVEIFDSVLGKMAVSDFAETDPNKVSYIRNKQLYQRKLKAGPNTKIDDETDTISSSISVEGLPELISTDSENALQIGKDGKLFANIQGLLEEKGDVPTRSELPSMASNYDSYMIADEQLIVFAYNSHQGALSWLPLNFFVDMNLYLTVARGEELLKDSKKYTDDKVSQSLGLVTVSPSNYTFDPQEIVGVQIFAVGRTQLQITFSPLLDVPVTNSVSSIINIKDSAVLPLLPQRFGQVWDSQTFEVVGFCKFDSNGVVFMNVISQLFAARQYIVHV